MITEKKQLRLLKYIFIFVHTLNFFAEAGIGEWPFECCALGSYDVYTQKIGQNGEFKIPNPIQNKLVRDNLKSIERLCDPARNKTKECNECRDGEIVLCEFFGPDNEVVAIDFPIDFVEIRIGDNTDTSEKVFLNPEVDTLRIIQMGEYLPYQANTLYGIQNVNVLIMESTSDMFEPLNNLQYLLSDFQNLTALYLTNYRIDNPPPKIKGPKGRNDDLSPLLPNLGILNLENSLIEDNTFTTFENSSIYYLCITESVLNITTNTLKPLQKNLLYLELQNVNLMVEQIYNFLTGLKFDDDSTILEGLSIADAAIETVAGTALQIVHKSLKYLSLSNNKIKMLRGISDDPGLVFPELPFVVELDLSKNHLEFIEEGAFSNLKNLEILILSENVLTSLCPGFLKNLQNLKHLDMSATLPTSNSGIAADTINFDEIPELETLDLSWTKIGQHSKFVGSAENIKNLSLCYSLQNFNFLNTDLFQNLSGLEILDVSGIPVNKDDRIGRKTVNLFKSLTSLKKLYMKSTFIKNLGLLNHVTSLEYLDLSGNEIINFDSGVIEDLKSLETLILWQNKIVEWTKNTFSESCFPSLRYINLMDNQIKTIEAAMMQDFEHLEQVDLCDNPFSCNCFLDDFLSFANNTNVSLNNGDLSCFLCNRNSQNKTFEMYVKENCTVDCSGDDCSMNEPLESWVYVVVVVFVFFMTLAGVFYWKWLEIRHFVHIVKDATVLSFMDDVEKEPFKNNIFSYDIFVSYCDGNREWVIDYLLPNLENKSNLRVCLHERDFQVGLSILENIITSMDKSRSILLVISQSFLRSNWCQFELHLAQHRLLETRREDLILILLEEIPKLKRPKMLQYLMKTKTYLIWPNDETDDAGRTLFWKRLCQATILHKPETEDKTFSFV